MEPKFAENTIAFVIYKRKYHWYCTEKALWKLDYRRLYDDYHNLYRRRGRTDVDFVREIGSFGEFISSRFRIPVADKDTAKAFLKAIEAHETSAGELAYLWSRAESDEVRRALIPMFYVDFDRKAFFSMYAEENGGFENYAPQGWQSAYCDFRQLIPADEQYWSE